MIQKFWSDMTHDEKLDVLRNDIERLLEVASRIWTVG